MKLVDYSRPAKLLSKTPDSKLCPSLRYNTSVSGYRWWPTYATNSIRQVRRFETVIDGEYFLKSLSSSFWCWASRCNMQQSMWMLCDIMFAIISVGILLLYSMDMKARIEQKCRAILPAQKDNLEVLHVFLELWKFQRCYWSCWTALLSKAVWCSYS